MKEKNMRDNVDMKDLRILRELDQNPDLFLNKLAKKIQISQQVIDYRVKNLFKRNIISKIIPIIDLSKLGFFLYRTHVRFKTISGEKRREFEDYIFKNFECFFIGAIGGKWDEYFDLFSENSQKFQEDVTRINEKFSDIIQEYDIMEITKIHLFNYKYLSKFIDEKVIMGSLIREKIDEIDHKILSVIKGDSRISYLDLGFKVKLSRNAVKERIKKMSAKGIIVGNRMFLNSKAIEKESYKLLLKMKSGPEDKEKFIKFVKNSEEVIYFLELLGKYNFDLEIEVDNREKLQEFIIKLRNNFNVIDYDLMPLFYDYDSDFFPIRK
jgi:Lrp/AsnC family leucine-responsive transcriptional regulator